MPNTKPPREPRPDHAMEWLMLSGAAMVVVSLVPALIHPHSHDHVAGEVLVLCLAAFLLGVVQAVRQGVLPELRERRRAGTD